jgi:PAS domain S-box-containing protein
MLVIDMIIGMLILSGISMACLGLYGRRFSDRIPAAVPYTLLMLSAAAWAVLYALDLISDSLQLRILYHNLRFLVLPFIPFLELWLVIAFVKKTEWLRKDWAAVVLVIPVAAALLAITSPLHTLFRYDFSINTSGPIPVLQYSEAPFYTLYFIYSFILLVIAIIILIVESRKRGTLWEEQTILLLLALALPTLINYLFFFGITLVPGVNMTAPLLWVAAILYTVSLFRYRFLDIIPIARSRLIEIMSTPMLVLDAGGRIIDLNPAACSLFSTTPSVAIGKPVNEIAPGWQDFLSLCRSDGTSRTDLIRDQEGGAYSYTGSVELVRTLSGEPEARLVLLQDVTEQKRAEKRAVHLASFPELTPVLILETDMHGSILYANPAILKATEMMGETNPRIFIPQDIRDRLNGTMIAKSVHEIREIEIHGKVFRENVYFTPEFSSLRVYATDITERERAGEALKESEEKFRAIFNSASDAIHIHEIGPDFTPGKFIDVNDVACRMLEMSREEILSHSPLDFATEYHNPSLPVIIRLFETKGSATFETGHRKSDGVIVPVEINSHIINLQGKTVMLGIIRDITERKKAEDLIKHYNEELEQQVISRTAELNASLEEKIILLREVHHRVKNNLQILISLMNLQSRTITDPQVNAALKDSTQRIRAMSMVHEKLHTGRDLAHIEFINYLSSLANSQFAFYQLSPGKVKLELHGENIMLDIDTAIPLGLVMNELVSNALKHAFPGDRKGTIRIDARETEGRLEITFADNGIGIPEGFDWKAAPSLGLRLVNILIEQLSGTIELDRTTGTAFNIIVKEKQ